MVFSSLYLRPAPPFRLDLTVWALRRMPHNEIDLWDGRTYTRVFSLDRALVKLDVSQPGKDRIRVELRADPGSVEPKQRMIPIIEKMLGLRINLGEFYRFVGKNDQLSGLAARFMGFKPPRFPSIYEALINAIACQQISLNVGIALLNRLSRTWGTRWTEQRKDFFAFPLPEALAGATVKELRELGFSGNKAKAIIAVSREVALSGVDLESLDNETDAAVTAVLTNLPGIGPWSAEYVMLRGLGRTHIFPGDDSGAQRSLQVLLVLKERPNAARTGELTRSWHPHAGTLYFHFLLNKLMHKGYIT